MKQPRICLDDGRPRHCINLKANRRSVAILLLVSLLSSCQSPQTNPKRENLDADYSRLLRVEGLLARSTEALTQKDFTTALGCLRQACGLNPGDKRIHWKMANAAEAAGEREVGYRALKVLVNLDPSLEEDPEVLTLAKQLALLKKTSRFNWALEKPSVKPEFSWSEFYKPQNPANLGMQ